jgi:hypothetical protein
VHCTALHCAVSVMVPLQCFWSSNGAAVTQCGRRKRRVLDTTVVLGPTAPSRVERAGELEGELEGDGLLESGLTEDRDARSIE